MLGIFLEVKMLHDKNIKMLSRVFYINEEHNDRSVICLYTVTGWGVMSCVCGKCGIVPYIGIRKSYDHIDIPCSFHFYVY